MADKKVRIVITGKDDASAALKSVNQSLLSVVKGAAAVAIAYKLMKKATAVVTEMVAESTKLAARNEMMATSLQVVGQNAGWTSGQLDKAVAAVKAMGITTGVATTTVTRYIQAQIGLGKSAAEASEDVTRMARVAQDLAVVAGVNSSEALETMQNAISGLRPILLRQFGITDGLVSIYDKYALTLNKTAEELTEVEKRQAVQNRIFEEGERVAGAYETAMGTVGKQMASLARVSEDAKAELGEAFLPAMSVGVTIATEFWKAIQDIAPTLRDDLAPVLEDLGTDVLPIVLKAIIDTTIALANFVGKVTDLINVLPSGRDAAAMMAGALTDEDLAVRKLNESLTEGIAQQEKASMRTYDHAQRVRELAEVVGEAAMTIGEAWAVAYDSEKVQGAVEKMRDIVAQHQTDLVDMQYDFGAKREAAEFDANVKQLIARAKHNAEMAQLQAAGDTEGMAKLQAKFDESQTLTEWDNAVQKQLAERGELEALVILRRKNLAELQAQHAAIKASITAETIAALSRNEIQRTAASKMLGIMGVSLTAALNTEKAFVTTSSDVFRKWGTNIVQTAATGVDAVRALMNAWAGDIAGAEAALADAQAALEGFTLDLPPLALPDLPSELGGAAAAATEAAQTVISDMTENMADAIASAKQMIEDLVGFELPEGWELGLDKYKTAMLAVSKKFAEIWRESQKQLEDAAKAAPGLKAIADSFGALVGALAKMTDFSEEAFEESGGFEAATLGYIERMEFVGVAMMDWIRRIGPEHRKMLADAAPVAKDIKELFSMLGPDLTKIVPIGTGREFADRAEGYFEQLEDLGKRIMKWIDRIKPEWRIALAEAAPVSENIKKLFGILGIDLEKLKAPKADFMAAFTAFLLNIEAATDVAVEILGRIKAKWGDELATAAETMKHAADIWKGVADMTKAIDEAAELGGPDIAAANAMAGMTNEILYGKPGQIGGAAAGQPGMMGDWTFRIGNIILEVPGVGTFESGEISERVAGNEGQFIDMRISMAAASI